MPEVKEISQPIEVGVGQIWQDTDKRVEFRQLKVISLGFRERRTGRVGSRIERIPVAHCLARRSPTAPFTGREMTIQVSRFKPNSTGYRLVAESEDAL